MLDITTWERDIKAIIAGLEPAHPRSIRGAPINFIYYNIIVSDVIKNAIL